MSRILHPSFMVFIQVIGQDAVRTSRIIAKITLMSGLFNMALHVAFELTIGGSRKIAICASAQSPSL